jgi:hypothetical protein
MRDDLLDAYAAVDWAVTQLPSLHERIDAWLSRNLRVEIECLPPPATHDRILAVEGEPFPLSFNVEAGAYINVIRSSLDMLASALSARHGLADNAAVHFPIYWSVHACVDPISGLDSISWLSRAEIGIIRSLKPYDGGNKTLFALHRLDIMRKHRRLLYVDVKPENFSITRGFRREDVKPGWLHAAGKTVLGSVPKEMLGADIKYSAYVTIDESVFPGREPIIGTLNEFAGLANSIISLFDTP